MLQGYLANVFFWANWPNELKVGTGWKDHEFIFRIPGPGERGYHEADEGLPRKIDFPDPGGSLLVNTCRSTRLPCSTSGPRGNRSGWTGTRRSPIRSSSIRDHDDYRLRPGSPAFELGFQPIPVENIGPYRDELRATWPIVEAAGLREHPVRPPH